MIQMMNWICLICVSFLVVEVMVYFCKDALKLCDNVENKNVRRKTKQVISKDLYVYEERIAK